MNPDKALLAIQLKHELMHFVAMRLPAFGDEAVSVALNTPLYKNLCYAVDRTFEEEQQ